MDKDYLREVYPVLKGAADFCLAAAYHIYRVLLNYISPDEYQGPGRRRGGGTYPNLLDAHSPFQMLWRPTPQPLPVREGSR